MKNFSCLTRRRKKKVIDRKVENEVDKADYTRLKMCMHRAKKGEELTIGFFGGSITQGSLIYRRML